MTPIEQLVISEAPAIIAFAQGLFKAKNPDLPVPTSAEVIAAYETVFVSSVAKDEAIKAAHPPTA